MRPYKKLPAYLFPLNQVLVLVSPLVPGLTEKTAPPALSYWNKILVVFVWVTEIPEEVVPTMAVPLIPRLLCAVFAAASVAYAPVRT